jgi:hypothetical protein
MDQTNATRSWEPSHNDLASTDEFPQTPDWLLDEVASGARTSNVELAGDTIPSPPPEGGDAGPVTIPAPPPLGDIGELDD